MNKNHTDILIAGSSELVAKYNKLAFQWEYLDRDKSLYYQAVVHHFLATYQRAVAKSRLTKDT